jgi:hypothetical protein
MTASAVLAWHCTPMPHGALLCRVGCQMTFRVMAALLELISMESCSRAAHACIN